MDLELDTAVAEDHSGDSAGDGRSARAALVGRWRSPLVTRVVRYALGSVIASLVSLVTFVLVYGVIGGLSPRQTSIAASLTGMVPAYFLNRKRAWGRRGQSHFLRLVLTKLAASVPALLIR